MFDNIYPDNYWGAYDRELFDRVMHATKTNTPFEAKSLIKAAEKIASGCNLTTRQVIVRLFEAPN